MFDNAEIILFNLIMQNLRVEIGSRIKKIRDKSGMNQDQFGAVLGVVKSSVSGYETGDGFPTIENLVKIAEVGNVSFDWLITGKDAIPSPEKQPITYPLGEDEQGALKICENLISRYGLDKQYAVVEIHHPPPKEERLSEYEKRLVEAFRKVDKQSQEVILTVAENTALAFNKGRGRSRPGEDGSPQTNCA